VKALPPAARSLYDDLRAVMEDAGRWDARRDGPLLDRLVVNLYAARGALEEAALHPWVPTAAGGVMAHPGFNVAARCDAAALAVARELRLTPKQLAGEGTKDESAAQPADPFAELDELGARRAARGPV
jgi:hypothetical protein